MGFILARMGFYGENMQGFSRFRTHLSKIKSDSEVATAFKEFFSEFGPVSSADRFFAFEKTDRRYFLIQFKEIADATNAIRRYNLRSFGFNGVMIELENFTRNAEC